MKAKNVPVPWKEARTVQIYKKADDTDVSNFRPIALMSCIYKLFMGVMAKGLTRWSIDAGILSLQQKCARPSEGCYEHTYILKSLVGQARRNKKKLNLAWLDIRNEFGSVPHSTIRATLRHIGVPQDIISLIMNAYTGATTVIKTLNGNTSAISIQAGVKQGFPLSPIIFNLCIALILCQVKHKASKLKSGLCIHYGTPVSCLTYADDLVIVARSQHALQLLLDAASDGANILGFSFRLISVLPSPLLPPGREPPLLSSMISPSRVVIFHRYHKKSRIDTLVSLLASSTTLMTCLVLFLVLFMTLRLFAIPSLHHGRKLMQYELLFNRA
jgi:hypothetical protein